MKRYFTLCVIKNLALPEEKTWPIPLASER